MESNLRPLTLGEILDRTAQLYRSNFWLFVGISAVYAGTLLTMNLLAIAMQEIFRAAHWTSQLVWVNGIATAVQFLFMFLFGGIAVAANNRAVAWVHLGEPASIRAAYASILPRAGRYLWLMSIMAFMLWLPFALVYGAYLWIVFFYAQPRGLLHPQGASPAAVAANQQATLMFGLATIAFLLLAALTLAYAAFMGLRYALAIAACVVEDLKARTALRRSIELSKGSRGRIFVLGLLVVAIQSGLVLVTQFFFILMAFKHHGELPPAVRVLQQLIAFVTNSFIGPMYATGLTLFYYDQRVRKEGYDIEWMMQAAGMTAPPAQPVETADLTDAGGDPASHTDEHATREPLRTPADFNGAAPAPQAAVREGPPEGVERT